jgi:translation initiation factor 2 alpha subunit (eIF-2alpha)
MDVNYRKKIEDKIETLNLDEKKKRQLIIELNEVH